MKIRVCELDFEVAFTPDLRDDSGQALYGLCDMTEGRIWLDEAIRDNPSLVVSTLVHEIMHAVMGATGTGHRAFGDDSDAEEHFIRQFTPGMITALQSAGLMRDRWIGAREPRTKTTETMARNLLLVVLVLIFSLFAGRG
jgi:hypothetical protein